MADSLKNEIDRQFALHQNKNLFYKNSGKLPRFSDAIIGSLKNAGKISPDDLGSLVNYTADKTLQELCRVNQYYSFHKNDIISLKMIYFDLYRNLFKGKNPVEVISHDHFEKLRSFLEKTNPFSKKLYQDKEAVLESVACFEYSAILQSEILHLHGIKLLEPILDIGCGKEGRLVKYLREKGLDTYGIDRFSDDSAFTIKADWLAYEYGNEKWGTIVSHLGFSNHFVHNHLREDGDYIGYAAGYMRILQSLKNSGCFYYAPDLPFIETYLDKKRFGIKKYDIKNMPFKKTIITKTRS